MGTRSFFCITCFHLGVANGDRGFLRNMPVFLAQTGQVEAKSQAVISVKAKSQADLK